MATHNTIANYPTDMFLRSVANVFFCHDGIDLEIVVCDDADLVVEKYWRPVLDEIESKVKTARQRDEIVTLAESDTNLSS